MYIQLNQNNEFLRKLPDGNIEFGPNHYQPAASLTEEEAATFKVHRLTQVDMPPFNPETQRVVGITPLFTAGAWVQRWEVQALSAEEIAAIIEAQTPSRRLTKLAFRNRFTPAEKVALEIAGLDNPEAAMPARAQAAALRVNQADLAAATFVDLQRSDTRAGVQMLETAGLLAAGRAAEILDAPIQPEERPLG